MPRHFLNHAVTESVRAAQQQYYGRTLQRSAATVPTGRDALSDDEMRFIGARDSFYLATVTQTGWPYVQHRGGPAGFLRVIDDHTLAFADRPGNRQLLSTGNIAANDRVALFLMDYPQRTRLKILGRARVVDAREHPEARTQVGVDASDSGVERIFFIEVVSYDWNCPKYITPRYSADEVEELVAPLHARIAELEAQVKRGGADESKNARR